MSNEDLRPVVENLAVDKRERTWLEEWTFAEEEGDLTPGSVPPGADRPSCGAPGDGQVRCHYCNQLRADGRAFRDVWKAAAIKDLQER